MRITDLPIPEIYLESSDFRFFLKWFETSILKIRFDTENVLDLYDPQRCPEHLLWMLGDTMGYKYDDRLSPAFCRLVLLYFMSMIRYKGSKSGVTLAAEVNLAQFNLQAYAKENPILDNRLEDTSIPVNSVYVTAHTPEGYIDVVYFSDRKPVDACIEYVRPLGMYCFQHSGVRYDGRTKISVDARLTNIYDSIAAEGITRVGHYSREDYARMQKMNNEPDQDVNTQHKRKLAWKRNSPYEDLSTGPTQDAGYRALYSLQMCNSEHMAKSLMKAPIFDLEYGPQDVGISEYNQRYVQGKTYDWQKWNLRYNLTNEQNLTDDIYTIDFTRTASEPPKPQSEGGPSYNPVPAVNPIMAEIGDAMNKIQRMTWEGVVKGQTLQVTNSEFPVCGIKECRYGDIDGDDLRFVPLVPGKDYRVSGSDTVILLNSSTIIPSSPDLTKELRVFYLLDSPRNHTAYNYGPTPDPATTPFVDNNLIQPRNTRDNT